MQQPEHSLKQFQSTQATPRRFASLIAVGGLHVIIIVALATGLASQLMQKPPTDLTTEVIKEKPPPDVKIPPPPPPDLVKPPPPFVPPPDIQVQAEAPSANTIQVQSVQHVEPKAAVSSPVAVGRPHVCGQRYYPPSAVRLGYEGTTTLGFTVNTDGSISNVHIVNSSGHDDLDQAAISCAQNWSNYKPAMMNGQPVAVPYKALVKWNLQGG
jgi:protein TonB